MTMIILMMKIKDKIMMIIKYLVNNRTKKNQKRTKIMKKKMKKILKINRSKKKQMK